MDKKIRKTAEACLKIDCSKEFHTKVVNMAQKYNFSSYKDLIVAALIAYDREQKKES